MRASLLSLLFLAACTTAAPPSETPHDYLAGTSWRRVDDDQSTPHGATMAFTENRASGNTGCNQWFASFTHDGEALHLGAVGTTRMACTSEVQGGTERRFLAMLEHVRYAHYDQDALVLLDQNQQVIAEFNRED